MPTEWRACLGSYLSVLLRGLPCDNHVTTTRVLGLIILRLRLCSLAVLLNVWSSDQQQHLGRNPWKRKLSSPSQTYESETLGMGSRNQYFNKPSG